MYLMISKYLVSLDEVAKVRSAHLAFLEGLYERGIVVAAGRQDPPVGGMVLLNVGDEALGHKIMADDPYVVNGIAEYTAMGWHPTVGALADYGKPS